MTKRIDNLKDLIRLHEGVRKFPYKDTVGKTTIGVGFNLTDVGLYPEEMEFMLNHRLTVAAREAYEQWPWIADLDPVRLAVIVDMSYNMGIPVLSQFKSTFKAIENGEYERAAKQMLLSKWAKQVGRRATRLSTMMRTGEWPSV